MSGTIDRPSPVQSDLAERAAELAVGFRERAAETEERRTLPEASVAELLDAGFARALVPARFGGDNVPWDVVVESARRIGMADASHAWCAGLMMEMSHFCGYLPREAQEALWADGPDVPIASSVIPAARITRDGDGYRITGRSPFASGVNHSAWSLVSGVLEGDRGPQFLLALVPASDYEIADTWSTTGMRGTGSNTIVTDGAFVPGTHVVNMADLISGDGPGTRWHDLPEYRLPWVSFGAITFLTPMLGAAQGALAEFVAATKGRTTTAGAPMADLPTVHLKMGKAAGEIDAAELLLRRMVEVLDAPEPPSLDLRARTMRDALCINELLVRATETVITMTGARAFVAGNALDRMWRDVRFMSTHIAMGDSGPIHWARRQLGLDLLPNQLFY